MTIYLMHLECLCSFIVELADYLYKKECSKVT
jgi:hypothetical protein